MFFAPSISELVMLSCISSRCSRVSNVAPQIRAAIAISTATLVLKVASPAPVWAQIITDNTLSSESSVFTPASITVNNASAGLINGGARRGPNLFHSFSGFNITEGQQVYFENPNEVDRIFSRVTGESRSDILGTLGVLGNADLFFLNPNGIVFGPNAALDVSGSFVASTADSLVFDNFEFSASTPEIPPLLTLNVPVGLQFGAKAQSIINQSQASPNGELNLVTRLPIGLQVQSDRTLGLVGGDIMLEGGNLTAAGGRIELGSLAASSFVSLTTAEDGWRLDYRDAQTFQNIQITPRFVDGSKILSLIDISGVGNGDIRLQGRNVILEDGSQISAINLGPETGGDLVVNASESVELLGNSEFIFNTNLSSASLATGDAGSVTINTGRLLIQDRASIIANSANGVLDGQAFRSSGRSGDITVVASESVALEKGFISASTQQFGDAGDITIRSGQLTLSDESLVLAFTASITGGQPGTVTIETDQLTVESSSEVIVDGVQGPAGNLNVFADIILLDNGALTAVAGAEEGAMIALQDLDLLLLRNGSLISAQALADADGGNVIINAPDGFVVATPDQDNDIIASAFAGQGGDIDITVQDIFGIEEQPALPDNGTNDIDASSEFGLDGDVTIETPDLDLNRAAEELPGRFETPRVSQGCQTSGGSAGRFISSGQGGLTPSPYEPLGGGGVQEDIYPASQTIAQLANEDTAGGAGVVPPDSVPEAITEAQGWMTNPEGEVVLVAEATDIASAGGCGAI